MRIDVDFDRCDGHGQCAQAAPEVFELGEDDLMRVLDEHPPPDQDAAVRAAAARCPKLAITLAQP